jgi:hypothetical protein
MAKTNSGAVYWRTIAFAAVVIFVAETKALMAPV